MISGNQIDGNPRLCDFDEGLHGHLDCRGWHDTAEEQITTVNDEVYLSPQGWCQGEAEVGEEIVAPSTSCDARSTRQVKTDVCVGEQEDAHTAVLPKVCNRGKLNWQPTACRAGQSAGRISTELPFSAACSSTMARAFARSVSASSCVCAQATTSTGSRWPSAVRSLKATKAFR